MDMFNLNCFGQTIEMCMCWLLCLQPICIDVVLQLHYVIHFLNYLWDFTMSFYYHHFLSISLIDCNFICLLPSWKWVIEKIIFILFLLIWNVLGAMYLKSEKFKHIDIIFELMFWIEFINVLSKLVFQHKKSGF